MMLNKIVIAIPCYNCERQIQRVLQRLLKLKLDVKIIIIDNRSSDESLQSAVNSSRESHNIEIYQNNDNYGIGGTFKLATQYALNNGYEFLAFLHGDDQADPADLLPMIRQIQDDQLDAIFGARFMRSSRLYSYSKKRELANRILNLLVSLVSFKKVYELGSGINIYRTQSLLDAKYNAWPNHIAFDIYLLMSFLKLNTRFHPISWHETDQNSTTTNIGVTVKILTSLFGWFFCNSDLHQSPSLDFKRIYP